MQSPSATAAPFAASESETYTRVMWRLLPFLFLCYLCAYLDRINVGYAKLQMMQDLGLSDAIYGLGAGIFFVGYLLFEVPSNLILLRARSAAHGRGDQTPGHHDARDPAPGAHAQ